MPKLDQPICSILIFIFLLCGCSSSAFAQRENRRDDEREMFADEAGADDALNRELWQRIKKTPYIAAQKYAARQQRKAAVAETATLPNNWRIAPVGAQTEVGRLPFEAARFRNQIVVLDTGYYSREPQEVSVVSQSSNQVVKVLRFPNLFPSAAVYADTDLYLSGGFGQKIYRLDRNFQVAREYQIKGYAAGIAVINQNHLAVLSLTTGNDAADFDKGNYGMGKLSILDTDTGAIEREQTVGYFPNRVSFINNKFYVTVLGENKLQIYDAALKPQTTLETGEKPQNVCVGGDARKLFVVNSGSDNLSVVDTANDKITTTINVRRGANESGAGLTSCAVDGNRIFVTQANVNSIAVLDANNYQPRGFVPTGWYPTKVLADAQNLFVVSAKGIRPLRPNVDGPQALAEQGGAQYVLTLLKGTLGRIPKTELDANLAKWTRLVANGAPPFDQNRAVKLPLRHVFYIVRENRAYDQVLGDLPRGDGDPFLTLFGRETTPNAHKLAEEFVTLDNFYADGEISVLGHSFTTSGYASPFLEWLGNAAYSGRYTGYPFGTVPAVTSPKYLWDALDAKGVSYKIYGENYFLYTRGFSILRETFGADNEITKKFYAQMMADAARVDRGNSFYQFAAPYNERLTTSETALKLLADNDFRRAFSKFLIGDETLAVQLQNNDELRRKFAAYLAHYAADFRSWDLATSDLERAAAWKADFERQLKTTDGVPQFNYLWLPNDHTGGDNKKYLPPAQLVAQNDAALGLVVATISNSAIWKDSIIFVTEDDAQNGADHVDATRTVGLAISPFVKRGAVIKDRYDQLSQLRTMEILLGLAPLNANDALAAPMFAVFADKADFSVYHPSAPTNRLSDADKRLYQNLAGDLFEKTH